MDKEIIGGNIYDKYTSKNPIVKLLMWKYFKDLDWLLLQIRDDINKALEIGCGEGYITKHIKNLGINITGADISEEIIELAKKLHPDINFLKMNVYDLSKTGKKWDLIVCCEVLEHLRNPERAIVEMKRSTNKYILLTVPNEPFFRLANIIRLKYLSSLGNTPGHINHWTIWSFKKFLNKFNFKNIKFKISTLWLMALCMC